MIVVKAIPGDVLSLGRRGENMARSVVFDIREWRSAFGDGTAQLLHQRPDSKNPYPCAVDQNGDEVRWSVTSADVAVVGYGRAELQFFSNGAIVKSEVWSTNIDDAMGVVGAVPPVPQQNWVERVLKASADAWESAKKAEVIAYNAYLSELSAEGSANEAKSSAKYAESNANVTEQLRNAANVDAIDAATSAENAEASANEAKLYTKQVKDYSDRVQIAANSANDSATNAKLSEYAAQKAQFSIEGMTVTSETLGEGKGATVTKSIENGVTNLHFGIPVGSPGRDGSPGKDGYTPRKGVDYFDGKDGSPGKDGVDGKNGVDGKDGYTPVKGVDYFDGKDGSPGAKGDPGFSVYYSSEVWSYIEVGMLKSLDVGSLTLNGRTLMVGDLVINGDGWLLRVKNVHGTNPVADCVARIPGSVKSVNGIAPDENGNVEVGAGGGVGARGTNSTAEIFNDYENNVASEYYAHAEGRNTLASGEAAHAEGYNAKAEGDVAHAEGLSSWADGYAAHAEGFRTRASGKYAHSEGCGTSAGGESQHVQGRYNQLDSAGKYAHIVGNGEDVDNTSNAHTLDWNGLGWFSGGLKVGGTWQDDPNAKHVATVDDIEEATDFDWLPVVDKTVIAEERTVEHGGVVDEIGLDTYDAGDKLWVSVDGVVYPVTVTNTNPSRPVDGTDYIGNLALASPGYVGTEIDTGEPFLGVVIDSNTTFHFADGAAHKVAIYAPNQLPVEFLPDGVPYAIDGGEEVLPDYAVSSEADFAGIPHLGLVAGKPYIVTINGVEYTCVAMAYSDGSANGVALIHELFAIWDLRPEAAANMGVNVYIEPLTDDFVLPLTFSIKGVGIVRKLDPRCVPDGYTVPEIVSEVTEETKKIVSEETKGLADAVEQLSTAVSNKIGTEGGNISGTLTLQVNTVYRAELDPSGVRFNNNRFLPTSGYWGLLPLSVSSMNGTVTKLQFGLFGRNEDLHYIFLGPFAQDDGNNLRIYPDGKVTIKGGEALHTGNKPSGTYTGNGSAVARTIQTGGLGNVVEIHSSNGSAIINPVNGLCYSSAGVSVVAPTESQFVDGVLTLATTNEKLNANGVTYHYQVL